MNSQCVCDAYGMCPQGCPYCAVCSGDDRDCGGMTINQGTVIRVPGADDTPER